MKVKHGTEYGYWKQSEMIDCDIENDEHCLKYFGDWYKGVKSGNWYFYDKSSKLIKTELYKKGKLVKTKEF